MDSESKTGAARDYYQLLDWNDRGKPLAVSEREISHPALENIGCKRILHLSGRSDLSGGPISMLRLIEGRKRAGISRTGPTQRRGSLPQ